MTIADLINCFNPGANWVTINKMPEMVPQSYLTMPTLQINAISNNNPVIEYTMNTSTGAVNGSLHTQPFTLNYSSMSTTSWILQSKHLRLTLLNTYTLVISGMLKINNEEATEVVLRFGNSQLQPVTYTTTYAEQKTLTAAMLFDIYNNLPYAPVLTTNVVGANINFSPALHNGRLKKSTVLNVTGDTYTLTILKTNTDITYNGAPVTTENIIVDANGTLSATGQPAKITPTVGANVAVTINGAAVSTGNVVSVSGASNTLQASNTKPTPLVTFTFDSEVQVSLNEINVVSGQAYPLTADAAILISTLQHEPVSLGVTISNMESFTVDGEAVASGATLVLAEGAHTLTAVGATAIPPVSLNAEGVTQFSVNGADFDETSLPYTFTPQAGRTNSIYVTGTADTSEKTITISGTHIASMTVNNTPVQLPYTVNVTEPLDISVSGEIYQVDVSSKGGAIITKKDGTVLSNGESMHTILDIDKDTYLTIDGTHKLTVSGQDIKTITINGVVIDVNELPVTITNNNMSASVLIGGYPPSEIHVSGTYIDTATLDGNPVEIGANGSVDLEVQVRDENHFLTVIGSQPREYNLTFNDNGTTDISVNGQEMQNGQVLPISDSKYISATPEPIPVHFDSDEFAIVQVNGVNYFGDFTTNVSRETYVEVNSGSCILTIDYGDNSYQVTVPQRMVTITAPHRNGWIFDTWTSNDIGIVNPRMVQCNIDLTGRVSAHLVANYQRYITCDKPNPWN